MYKGLLIKESFQDRGVLDRLTIVKEDKWDVDNAVKDQSSVWNVAWFEIVDEEIDEMVDVLSSALEKGKWFLEISSEDIMIVVFPGKVFKYQKGDLEAREQAKEYGRSIGIPEDQLDWKE